MGIMGCFGEGNFIDKHNRQIILKEKKNYFLSDEYETHIVEYIGDIAKAMEKLDYAQLIESESFYSVIAVKRGMVAQLLKDIPEIINTEKNHLYTLSDIEKVDRPYDNKAIDKEGVTLDGEGVIVGIIDTGIDYLNSRFTTPDGRTRIVSIWDQTIEQGSVGPSSTIGYGTEFDSEQIDEAIKARNEGRNPYDIVPHRDEEGHGSAIAGIVGGRKFGVDDDLVSIAPKCEFALVKLKKAKHVNLQVTGIAHTNVNIYEGADIGFAIKYLANLQRELNKPMVVYLPLGTNCSGHDGESALERYIRIYQSRRGFIVVTDCGDEGDGSTHTSGTLAPVGKSKVVDLSVDSEETNFCMTIWISRPNKISIGVIAPSGERVETLPMASSEEGEAVVKFSSNQIKVEAFIQEETGGEQILFFYGSGNVGGIWQFTLTSEYSIEGRYDCWILQRKLLKKNTRFLIPDPYTTLTTPATGVSLMATSYYNQRNNSIAPKSGRGYTRDGRVKPGVTAAGVDVLTVGKGDDMIVVQGAAVGGSILAGATALLLQWGIVQGNDRNLFTAKAGNYIIRSTKKIEGVTFPNEEWGYGILSISNLSKSLEQTSASNPKGTRSFKDEEVKESKIFVRMPVDVYERLV